MNRKPEPPSLGGQGDLVPPLRPDVRLDEAEKDGAKVYYLVDAKFRRRVRLDRRGRDVAALLDRPQDLRMLLDRISLTGTSMAPEALRRVLNALDGLGLLDGSARPAVDWGEGAWRSDADAGGATSGDVEPVPLLIPEDLRFTCTGCGSCCIGVNVGPVGEDVAQNIRDHMAELDPESALGKTPFFTMVPEGEDEEILVCQTRNGACIFLDPDGLCRVHRRLGERAKPLICRLFPYRFVWTPQGVLVGLQTECRDILRASLGQPVREQETALRDLLHLIPKIPRVRPHVSLDGETTFSYSDYLTVEREVLDAVEAAADQGGWGMLLAGTRALLGRCRKVEPPPDREDLRVAFYSLLRDVGETLIRLKSRYHEEGERIRFHTGNLDMLVEALRDSPLFARRIFSAEEGDGARFARLVIVNYWRSREEVFGPPDLLTAAGELAFAWFMTRAQAVSRARQVHRLDTDPRDLVDAWVSTHMLLRNHRVREAFHRFREQVRRTFAHHLGALIEHKAHLEQANPQTDFYLF